MKARCRRKAICRNCTEDDHISDKTNKCSYEPKCENCGEGHMTGSNDCEFEKRRNGN